MARRPAQRMMEAWSLVDGDRPGTAQRISSRSEAMGTSRMHAGIVAIGLGIVVTMGAAGSGRVWAKESGAVAPMTAQQTAAAMAAFVDTLQADGSLTPYFTE